MTKHIVGLDIGGANIKAAHVDGQALCQPFEMWKNPAKLAPALEQILGTFPCVELLAVTMTAELADCFETKAEGVEFILTAVEQAARGIPVVVWQTGAEFVPPHVARDIPLMVAAANWHALATWVGRLVPVGCALLLDVGSTTADIIPLCNGVPVPRGLTDVARLQSGELVYTGVRRTPLCALAEAAPFRGVFTPLAAELFATTLDAYLTLGLVAEDADDTQTANGLPATRAAALDRLARSLCCDRTEFTAADAEVAARFFYDRQRLLLTRAFDQVLALQTGPCSHVLVSGSGSFLAEAVLDGHPQLRAAERTDLTQLFGSAASQAACAFAVSRLASERV